MTFAHPTRLHTCAYQGIVLLVKKHRRGPYHLRVMQTGRWQIDYETR